MKDELSDTEGLRYKLEDRQKDILELKKALRVKVRFHVPVPTYTHTSIPITHIPIYPLGPCTQTY